MGNETNILAEFDDLLKRGQADQVKARLKLIKRKDVERALLAPLARIGMRVALPQFSLYLLSPLVRPGNKLATTASGREVAQYAIALVQIGAVQEGISLLESITDSTIPEVYLYHAIGLFNIWDYQKAIPILNQYLKLEGISSYERLVGMVNLLSAYIVERDFKQAQPLRDQLMPELQAQNYLLMLGNVLELSAQLAMARCEYSEALVFVEKARGIMPESNQRYHLFLNKWHAAASLFIEGVSPQRLRELQEVRESAGRIHHWETMRECDLYQAICTNDIALFQKVYVGTPFRGFRKRMQVLSPFKVEIPEFYDWNLGDHQNSRVVAHRYFDIERGIDSKSKAALKPGQLLHRLLRCLAQDFYRRSTPAGLFAKLFPDRFYDYLHSNSRIHELVHRTRHWIQSHKIPLEICEEKGEYFLGASGTIKVRVSSELDSCHPILNILLELVQGDFNHPISCSELIRHTKKPRRSANRLLHEAVAAGYLIRVGRGKKTQYFLAPDHQPKKCEKVA